MEIHFQKSLPVLALAKTQTAATCTLVPNCCQKRANSASGTGKTSNSIDMFISAKMLPKVCQVCQCTVLEDDQFVPLRNRKSNFGNFCNQNHKFCEF